MKKVLSIILCLVMALSIFTIIPVSAQDADLAETGATTLLWPVEGHTGLTRGIKLSGNNIHYGIDICDGSINGATVRAAIGGTVVSIWKCSQNHFYSSNPFPSCCSGNGHGLVIRGDDGRYYNHAHMQSGSIPDNVYYGARVEMGQVIGRVGNTGNSSGAHHHFQISTSSRWWDSNIVDPMSQNYIYSLVVTPGAPSNVNLNTTEMGKTDSLVASWSGVSNATGYNARLICTTNSAYNQTKNGIGGTSVSFTLNNTGSYYVLVSAYNSAGTSGETRSATATVHENCTVRWVDYDDTLILTQSVKYNGTAKLPASNPVREGYTFQGWDRSNYNIKQDTTIKATYKINTYTVSFVDYKGDLIDSMQRINYSDAATPPTDIPTKPGYVFIGWSSDEYLCVKKNMTIKAVYEWENTDLPSILSISSAVRNEEATGYNVKVKLANFPNDFTKGKLIVALKTKEGKMVASETRSVSMPAEQEYTENVLVLYSGIVSIVEVSMVGVIDDETTGTPKAKSVVAPIDIGNEWSDWSVNVPTGNDIITDSRTEYRYKDSKTIKATSQPTTPSGYSFVSSQKTGTYTNWGSWSGWSTTPRNGDSLTQVETTTGYRYYAFVCPNCGQRDPYQGGCSRCGYNLTSGNWDEMYYPAYGPNIKAGDWDNNKGYVYINGVQWTYEKPGASNGWNGTGQPTCTMYHYCTRQEYVNYRYTQNSFSAWQPEKVTASSDRQVETRTTYRFKTNSTEVPCYNYKRYRYTNLNSGKEVYTYSAVYPDSMEYPGEWEYFKSFNQLDLYRTVDDGIELYNGIGDKSWYKADLNSESESTIFETTSTLEDTDGTKRHLEGTLENTSNKVVTLIVFKGQNTDPIASQIEYAGQTTTDENGFYSFDYITKEEPSIQTGDFMITIGAEGATNYINVGKIEAPKPVYVVDFVDDEGNLITETNVVAGGTAEAPDSPEKEGYEFIGWDTALKNIQENILVTAVYRIKTYVVIFVDWDESVITMKEMDYGSELTADTIPEKAGKRFDEWIDSSGESVKRVTGNMVVSAKYADAKYVVTFFDADGNILSEQEVTYGNKAIAPTAADAPSSDMVFSNWDSNGEELFITRSLAIKPVFKYTRNSSTPRFTIDSGSYNESQNIGIYSLTANTKLYYYIADANILENEVTSMDDNLFNEYNSPIDIDESKVIFAYAETANMNKSDIVILNVKINDQELHYLGDVDGDGDISSIDATYIVRYSAQIDIQIDEADLMRGDVDGNEEIEIVDATYIQRFLAEFNIPYPIGEPIA